MILSHSLVNAIILSKFYSMIPLLFRKFNYLSSRKLITCIIKNTCIILKQGVVSKGSYSKTFILLIAIIHGMIFYLKLVPDGTGSYYFLYKYLFHELPKLLFKKRYSPSTLRFSGFFDYTFTNFSIL